MTQYALYLSKARQYICIIHLSQSLHHTIRIVYTDKSVCFINIIFCSTNSTKHALIVVSEAENRISFEFMRTCGSKSV